MIRSSEINQIENVRLSGAEDEPIHMRRTLQRLRVQAANESAKPGACRTWIRAMALW